MYCRDNSHSTIPAYAGWISPSESWAFILCSLLCYKGASLVINSLSRAMLSWIASNCAKPQAPLKSSISQYAPSMKMKGKWGFWQFFVFSASQRVKLKENHASQPLLCHYIYKQILFKWHSGSFKTENDVSLIKVYFFLMPTANLHPLPHLFSCEVIIGKSASTYCLYCYSKLVFLQYNQNVSHLKHWHM